MTIVEQLSCKARLSLSNGALPCFYALFFESKIERAQRVNPIWIFQLLYCFILLAGSSAFGFVGNRTISNFVHRNWTDKDGAPTAIQAIAQTKDGLLWLGTAAGLYQFDGVTFVRYNSPSWAKFPAHVSCLLALPDGDLWVGFRYGAISVVRNGNVSNYGPAEGVPIGRIYGFAQDQAGILWVATSSGLARFQGNRWKQVGTDWNFKGILADAVFVDHRGTLWVSTEHTIEFLPAGARQFQPTGIHIGQVFQIAEAADQRLWIADMAGAVRTISLISNPGPKSDTEIPVESPKILFDRSGALWMTTVDSGVRRADFTEWKSGKPERPSPVVESFTRSDGLSDDRTNAILQDREGNVWVGSRNGLDRFEESNIKSLSVPFVLDSPVLAAGDGGDLWIGKGSTGQLFRIHLGHLSFGRQLGQLMGAYRDPEGTIWWIGPSGIYRPRNGSYSWLPLPEGPSGLHAAARLTINPDGDLLMAEGFQGVFRYSNGRWMKIKDGRPLEKLVPGAGFTDWLGRVWFGYEGGTIAVFNRTRLEKLYPAQESPVGTIRTIQGAKGHVWLGGELGLALSEGDHLYQVFLADMTPFQDVLGIVETSGGDLWLSESRGVVHISSSEVRKVLDHPGSRVHGQLFDALDGLPGDFRDDQTFPTEIEGTDGRIWFVTTNGISWIDPANILKNTLPPTVLIRAVSANKTQYSSWSNLTLPALTHDLHIGYSGVSLSIPERVRFRYKLEGADRDWQDAGARREATYNSLAPGTYRFRVIACNNDGVWNEDGAAFDFTIAPAWYQTRSFFASCVLAGGILIWGIYQIRMRQMARQLKGRFDEVVAERTRIARDLHDTLVQTIQGSKMVVEDGLKAPSDLDRMHHALQRSSLFLEQATQEARAALNSLRISTVETNDLADAFRRALEDCKRESPIGVSFSVIGHPREMHPVVRDEIYRIGYEAIRNACKHSHASRLDVELTYSQDIRLRIADNGVGIDPASAERGKEGHYGLQGMRERADRIAAKLTIVSSVGSGTEITVLIPGRISFAKGAGITPNANSPHRAE